jgi:hypothetical protein
MIWIDRACLDAPSEIHFSVFPAPASSFGENTSNGAWPSLQILAYNQSNCSSHNQGQVWGHWPMTDAESRCVYACTFCSFYCTLYWLLLLLGQACRFLRTIKAIARVTIRGPRLGNPASPEPRSALGSAHPPVDRKTVFAGNVELAHYRHTLLVFDDLD